MLNKLYLIKGLCFFSPLVSFLCLSISSLKHNFFPLIPGDGKEAAWVWHGCCSYRCPAGGHRRQNLEWGSYSVCLHKAVISSEPMRRPCWCWGPFSALTAWGLGYVWRGMFSTCIDCSLPSPLCHHGCRWELTCVSYLLGRLHPS